MLFSNKIISNNPYTSVYGLGRSLVALSTLITLLFSPYHILFDETIFNIYKIVDSYDYLNLYVILGFKNILLTKWISIIILFFVIIGIYPQITGILHFWIAYSFLRSSAILEGGDQINVILTFFFIPLTLLDSRKNHWDPTVKVKEYKRIIGNNIIAIISIQMSLLYLHAGIEKIYKLDDWVEGTAIYYIFNDSLFGASPWLKSIINPIVTNAVGSFALSWGTIFLEILLFGGIFMTRKKKKLLFIFAILFHVGIAIAFGLISFLFSMAGGLCIYLLPSNYDFIELKQKLYIFLFRKKRIAVTSSEIDSF